MSGKKNEEEREKKFRLTKTTTKKEETSWQLRGMPMYGTFRDQTQNGVISITKVKNQRAARGTPHFRYIPCL